jgi:hypothetical protein
MREGSIVLVVVALAGCGSSSKLGADGGPGAGGARDLPGTGGSGGAAAGGTGGGGSRGGAGGGPASGAGGSAVGATGGAGGSGGAGAGSGGAPSGSGGAGAGSGGAASGSGGAGAGSGGAASGSGGAGAGSGGAASGSGGAASGSGGAGGTPCQTSLTGTVYDPAGRVALYNVLVYVPSSALEPLPSGISCGPCQGAITPRPITTALTDTTGRFVLPSVPPGANVPFVMQVGKWRRQVTIPNVPACAQTPITDANLTRLPRNQTEGDLPRIAMVTGGSSVLECLLRNMGIADSEFSTETGQGRVHLFAGGTSEFTESRGATQLASGEAFTDAYQSLFPVRAKMNAYDHVILGCEGSQLNNIKMPHLANIKAYADGGGRILMEHLHIAWIRDGLPPWPSTFTWLGRGTDPGMPLVAAVNTTFPKGAALTDWLVNVGASTTRGRLSMDTPMVSVTTPVAAGTQTWVTIDQITNPQIPLTTPTIPLLSFPTPVEAQPADQCGRVDLADMHVASGTGTSDSFTPFPIGCSGATTLSPQQKLWEFIFFDIASCVQRAAAAAR